MNGDIRNIITDDLDKVIEKFEKAENEDTPKCPVGPHMPEGLHILLKIQREQLRVRRNGASSFIGKVLRSMIGGK